MITAYIFRETRAIKPLPNSERRYNHPAGRKCCPLIDDSFYERED